MAKIMTLRFIDSFDHYATADLALKYSDVSVSSAAISSGNGRRSTKCLRLSQAAAYVSRVHAAHATWIVGFAFKTATLPGSTTAFLSFYDGATLHVDIRMLADGTLRATRNGTTLATSTSALSAGTFYSIECKVTIDDAAGVVELRVNGSSTGWINITSQDTRNAGNASANLIKINGLGVTNVDYDDFYICDGAGSVNNDFLGDVRVDCYMPDGNGNSSQLVGSDSNSTDNYLLVDEASQNGDTDYVQSSTVNNKDTYTIADMSHTPTSIFGTQLNMVAKKDDSGTRSICSVVRSAGTDYDGDTQALSAASYVDYRQIRETDPATSAAWTRTNLNNAEFGVKVAA
jgi:hypothetical protein